MVGRIRNVDELNVLVGIDALLEKCAAHVNVLGVTARRRDFQRLAAGLGLCDDGFECNPVFARQRQLVG